MLKKKIINKDLPYSTGNYTQYLVVNYNGKESEKQKVSVKGTYMDHYKR